MRSKIGEEIILLGTPMPTEEQMLVINKLKLPSEKMVHERENEAMKPQANFIEVLMKKLYVGS